MYKFLHLFKKLTIKCTIFDSCFYQYLESFRLKDICFIKDNQTIIFFRLFFFIFWLLFCFIFFWILLINVKWGKSECNLYFFKIKFYFKEWCKFDDRKTFKNIKIHNLNFWFVLIFSISALTIFFSLVIFKIFNF